MKTPDWFLDWSGETCVIVASGPSARDVCLDTARGRAKFIATNRSYQICPWADVLYGCDAKWWISEKGVPEFAGLRVSGERRAAEMYEGVVHATVLARDDRIMMDTPGTIGSGGNSGFQALNLGLQFGVRKFVLVGFDMNINNGLHWHGAHVAGLNNPNLNILKRWCRSFDGAAPELAKSGITVLNASPVSALTKFEKVSFQEAIDRCTSMSP